MIYILLLFLIIMIIYIYILNGKNILSPSFITTGVFIISTISYIIYFKQYRADISILTFSIIMLAITSMFIGELMFRFGKCQITVRNKKTISVNSYANLNITIPIQIIILFLGIEIWAATRRACVLINIGQTIGYTGGISMLISNTRSLLTSSKYKIDTFTQILSSVSAAIAYLFCYYYIRERILFKRSNVLYLAIIASYFVMQIFTTGRQGFIEIIIIIFIEITLIIYNSNKFDSFRGKTGIIIKYAVIALLAIGIIFYFYGKFFRHSTNTLLDSLGEYVAAPLYGLDFYLENRWDTNNIFGQFTLKNYYYYLNKFGANYQIVSDHLPFFNCANTSSNIYTSLVLPIQDYGILGMVISRFFIGIIYIQLMFQSKNMIAKNIKWHTFKSVLYSYMMVAVVYSGIADKYKDFFTVTSFPLLVISLIIVNNICLHNTKLNTYNKN